MTKPLLHSLVVFSVVTLSANEHVSDTEALAPQLQREKFHLPPGFEIQLVLSEEDIGQPMNISFDVRGRLWVTSSVEYPYPAQEEGVEPRPDKFQGVGREPPSDWLTVAKGIGPDGKPSKITRFLENLNIPIGQTPLGDGRSGIVYEIPNISAYTDSNNDGLADQKKVLYGKFGNVDTHGMANSFRFWIDGWIYGCHGFSNSSSIVDLGGRETKMHSGHTYRFRPDGSEFEIYTRGQVNPFGLTIDPLGNVFSADCHSKPLYQLLPGSAVFRPSWAKPFDEPLGFAPDMIDHTHGSTGICGPAYYSADHFPKEYRDCIFVCNPVTGEVHVDKLIRHGSTLIADEQPDFLTCDDPWFRPVDAAVGPDGALYIADFYNAVIGHYEVPLDHEKRDRSHGRVWRIIYKNPPEEIPNLTLLNSSQLVESLESDNEALRVLISQRLVDQWTAKDKKNALRHLDKFTGSPKAHLLWTLERKNLLNDSLIREAAGNENEIVAVHAQKILTERSDWTPFETELSLKALQHSSAFVVRAAADGMRRHPEKRFINPLLRAWEGANKLDTHLIHVLKMAIREQMLHSNGWTDEISSSNRLIEVAAATANEEAARFVLLESTPENEALIVSLKVNASFLSIEALDSVTRLLRNRTLNTDESLRALEALRTSVPEQLPREIREWAIGKIREILDSADSSDEKEVKMAVDLAGSFGLEELYATLIERVRKGDLDSCKAVLHINPSEGARLVLRELSAAPAEQRTEFGRVICSYEEGIEILLAAIENEEVGVDILSDAVIAHKIGLNNPRLIALLAKNEKPNNDRDLLIEARLKGYQASSPSSESGRSVFQAHCTACHSTGGQGGSLGPNLDGIKSRGAARLIEDILDPNRNIDPAFALTTVRTKEGHIISGIGARKQDGNLVLVDSTGRTERISLSSIDERSDSTVSMMPTTFGTQISEPDFYQLLAYLMSPSENN